MKAAYRYAIAGQRCQVACNDKGKWYGRAQQLNGQYTPWKAIAAPRITRDMLQTNKGMTRVEKMSFEPFDLPKN